MRSPTMTCSLACSARSAIIAVRICAPLGMCPERHSGHFSASFD
jgi:hypothetical protein